jgi:hypothetical protein
MNAKAVVAALLEADPDEVDPHGEVARYTNTMLFDEGIADIVSDARALYERLVKAGLIRAETGKAGDGIWAGQDYIEIAGNTGFDSSSLAQVVLKVAIEQRGSPGCAHAYKLLKRHGHSIL